MKRYHHFEYIKARKSIFYFISFELTLFIISPLLLYFNTNDSRVITLIIYCQGYYTLMQSFGILYLKKLKDPLEGISKLGYLQLVSIN